MVRRRASARTLIVLFLLAFMSLFSASASAAELTEPVPMAWSFPAVTDGGGSAPVGVCGSGSGIETGTSYLPTNRWSVGSQHTRLGDGILTDIAEKIQRNGTVSGLLDIGHTLWKGTIGFSEWANRLCIGDAASTRVDQMVGKVGTALTSSGLVVGIFAVAVIMVLVQARKGENATAGIAKAMIGLALFGIVLNGATKTTDTEFGKGSPGWFATTVNKAVTAVANKPAEVISATMLTSTKVGDEGSKTSALDCRPYTLELVNAYNEAYGSSQGSTIPKVLDGMWRTTGLKAYTNAQFGVNNPYGEKVACRLLEFQSGRSAWDLTTNGYTFYGQQTLTRRAAGPGFPITQNGLPWALYDNAQVDKAMVFYAACNVNAAGTTWSVDPAWEKVGEVDKDHKVTAKSCGDYWNSEFSALSLVPGVSVVTSDSGSVFDWSEDPQKIAAIEGTSPAVADFLYSLHGNRNTDAVGTAFVYFIASLVIFVIIGGLSLAVIVGKIALLGLTFIILFVLVAALLPGSSDNKAGKVAKQYLSISLFTAGSSIILAFIAVLTAMLQEVGAAALGSGGVMGAAWTGFAPLAAMFTLNYVATKLFKAPSVFKPNSALAWGTAAAAGGMASGMAFDRFMRRGMSRGRMVARRAGHGLENRLSGAGRPSRRRGALAAAAAAGGVAGGVAGHHGHGGGQGPGGKGPADPGMPEYGTAGQRKDRTREIEKAARKEGRAERRKYREAVPLSKRAQDSVRRHWKPMAKRGAVAGGAALVATAFAAPLAPVIGAVAAGSALRSANKFRHARKAETDRFSVQKQVDTKTYTAKLARDAAQEQQRQNSHQSGPPANQQPREQAVTPQFVEEPPVLDYEAPMPDPQDDQYRDDVPIIDTFHAPPKSTREERREHAEAVRRAQEDAEAARRFPPSERT